MSEQSHTDFQMTVDLLGKMFSLDIMGIFARMVAILKDPTQIEGILRQQGATAQSLLNLLQSVSSYVIFLCSTGLTG
jgi:hypothetical protein